MGFAINKWQRIVLVLAALTCAIYAFAAAMDDHDESRPGLPFIVSIILATISLSSPRKGEAAWPTFPAFDEQIRKKAIVFGALAIGAFILLIVLSQADFRRHNYDTADLDYPINAATDATDAVARAAAQAAADAAADTAEMTVDSSVPTYNPSFDCGKLLNNTERMICKDEEISQKDRQLSAAFKSLLKRYEGEDRRELLVRQRGLLSDRSSCPNSFCISKWYDEQLANIEYLLVPPVVSSDKTPLRQISNNIPTRIGDCVTTAIEEIGTRLQGTPGSGSAIVYRNRVYGVDYSTVPQLEASQVGDPIKLCLVFIPKNCPPGDDRGRVYSAFNLRTKAIWELPDASHQCGGA